MNAVQFALLIIANGVADVDVISANLSDYCNRAACPSASQALAQLAYDVSEVREYGNCGTGSYTLTGTGTTSLLRYFDGRGRPIAVVEWRDFGPPFASVYGQKPACSLERKQRVPSFLPDTIGRDEVSSVLAAARHHWMQCGEQREGEAAFAYFVIHPNGHVQNVYVLADNSECVRKTFVDLQFPRFRRGSVPVFYSLSASE